MGAIARLGGSDVAAKIWDNGMGNNFLCSEARYGPSVHSETEFNGIVGLLTYIGDDPRLSNRRT